MMLLAAFDWNAFWSQFASIMIVLIPAFFGWLNLRGKQNKIDTKLDNQNVEAAIVKEETQQVKKEAKEVKETLATATAATEDKLKELVTINKKTHALVNGPHLLALKECVRVSKRLANITHEPEDIKAARAAEILLENNTDFTASLNKD